MVPKYCIVSLIFNNYEFVREVIEKSPNCDYFLFTDNKDLKSDTWTIIYLPGFDTDELTDVQKTYIFKYSLYRYIPNFSDYSYIIRLDHSIKINKSLDMMINHMDTYKYDIMCNIHPERDSFYDEYDTWQVARQLDPKYKKIFFNYTQTDNIGLVECTMMIYKNTKEVLNLLDNVFCTLQQYNNFEDKNDQCYFTNELYKMKDKLRICWGTNRNYTQNPYNKSNALILNWHNHDLLVDNSNPQEINKIFNRNQIIVQF